MRNASKLVVLLILVMTVGAVVESETDVEPFAAALIVINLNSVTLDFAGTGTPFPDDWRTSGDEYIVDANVDLIREARNQGVLIIYLYGDYAGGGEGEMLAFPADVEPRAGDILIARPGPNLDVFLDTPLLEMLWTHGVQTLLFSGLNTRYCVDRSAMASMYYGFRTIVVADAHSGGAPTIASRYNDYWPVLGMEVVPSSALDFAELTTFED
jgi:nicotinamidase-related amidase